MSSWTYINVYNVIKKCLKIHYLKDPFQKCLCGKSPRLPFNTWAYSFCLICVPLVWHSWNTGALEDYKKEDGAAKTSKIGKKGVLD